jgi:hypothetical protein
MGTIRRMPTTGAGRAASASADMAGQRNLTCSVGLHRWETRDHEVFTCFRCEKQLMAGKALRCRLGRHRWMIFRPDDAEAYRECFFCHKRTSLPRWALPLGD